MQHLEHDRLVFLALGESEVDVSDRTHLDACPHCRAELDSLRHVAGLSAAGQELRDLPDPPEHVWQGIMAEITAAEELPRLADRQRPGGTDPVTTDTAPAPRRSRRGRWSRLATTAVTAVAAATVAVIGTAAVLRDGTPAEPTVLASAPLAAYGSTPPTARGDARVLGSGELHLHVANLPAVPGYYEVWLINPRNMEMFSVGVLGDGSDVLLPLPPNVDLGQYSVVDVSAEQFDNNTAHSGDSLLRGSLTG
ncbi:MULTISPECIES: anti-sigma factor [unclassified Micromonospora]|uniref:anti-sigma factor n=1 Tax=unclassified Micromonospora TaxID=2617518 RepID=UPI0022B71902|nr:MULTISPECIES: anti-sigma factor [unclassified Micromonospora]MCZ7420510.1 anti-sigma factor [Verrucosispora sp. WMMA2121]WBB89001.1 anti-sigma factor [Verrucosispora sp. WMMC514]